MSAHGSSACLVAQAVRLQPKRKVLSMKQSPLNGLQWNISLDCGHDVWITAKAKPQRKTLRCEKCAP